MEKGVIFDIKEFAVFDGPGMRQTVFFKGCSLRCRWCHNPEGLSSARQLAVSRASCIRCGKCEEICTNDPCTVCGKCIPVCPLHLRNICGEMLTSDELVVRIRKNSDYYAKYGGGVTFSGGEPLMQADFLIEVLRKIPDLHRAVETSGYCAADHFSAMMENMDYIMMDLKIMDAELHKKYTGADNREILQNAKQLCGGTVPFVIRIPVIPGVNDSDGNFRKTAEWIAGAKALLKVELLPYHKTAGAKYETVGKEYRPGFDTEQKVSIPHGIFEEYGIKCETL